MLIIKLLKNNYLSDNYSFKDLIIKLKWILFGTLLRYKFSDLNFISPLTKIPTQTHKLFWTHKHSSYILPKYYPCHWAPTNISYIKSHKLPWALSKILPIISHILSNLGFPRKILTMLLPKLSHKIMLSPQKNTQNHSTYGQSTKAQQNLHTKPQQNLHTKPTMIWHL